MTTRKSVLVVLVLVLAVISPSAFADSWVYASTMDENVYHCTANATAVTMTQQAMAKLSNYNYYVIPVSLRSVIQNLQPGVYHVIHYSVADDSTVNGYSIDDGAWQIPGQQAQNYTVPDQAQVQSVVPDIPDYANQVRYLWIGNNQVYWCSPASGGAEFPRAFNQVDGYSINFATQGQSDYLRARYDQMSSIYLSASDDVTSWFTIWLNRIGDEVYLVRVKFDENGYPSTINWVRPPDGYGSFYQPPMADDFNTDYPFFGENGHPYYDVRFHRFSYHDENDRIIILDNNFHFRRNDNSIRGQFGNHDNQDPQSYRSSPPQFGGGNHDGGFRQFGGDQSRQQSAPPQYGGNRNGGFQQSGGNDHVQRDQSRQKSVTPPGGLPHFGGNQSAPATSQPAPRQQNNSPHGAWFRGKN